MRRLMVLRALPCLLASLSLALSPLATLHAHVSEEEATVVHGGHSHDGMRSHSRDDEHVADEHANDHVDEHASAHSATHLVVQHAGQVAHDHAIDGHIVHCDVVAVQPDTSFKTQMAMGQASEPQPVRRAPLLFKPPESTGPFTAHRFYLQPPLRGPPART